MNVLLAACGGFLAAVLWMDLIFDVQVLGVARGSGTIPERILASISDYYRRATTESQPMSRLIALVMVVAVLGSASRLLQGRGGLGLRVITLGCVLVPAVLAAVRIVPNAVRLGERKDDLATQSRLALAICRDHLICFALIGAYTLLQFLT